MILTHAKNLVVGEIEMQGSPVAWGKTFKGDYARSPLYITDVISELSKLGVTPVPGQTLGIFYDDPSKKEADQLMSFQGVFVEQTDKKIPAPLIRFSFEGRYLYVRNSGDDVMKMIFEAYDRLFNYVRVNNVDLKSPGGYQVLSNTNTGTIVEILMEIK